MKIKVKKGIAIIEIVEGDASSSSELIAIADEMKQSITGLNAIVAELSNIVLNGLHEQVTNLTTSVQMLSSSVTMITEKFESVFQNFSSVSIVNSFNQYITMPCPPGAGGGEGGKEGEKKEEDKSPFELFKEIFEDLKGIKDLYDKLKHAYKIIEGIIEKDWEEVGEEIGEVIEDVLKDDVAEMVGEVFGEIVEVAAELVLAADPIVWAAAAIALVGVAAYEIYKNSQNNSEQQPSQENNPLFQQPQINPAMPPGTFQNHQENPVNLDPPKSDNGQTLHYDPEFGTGGLQGGTTFTIPPPAGQPPLGAYGPGSNGLNSGSGNQGGQGRNSQSPGNVNSNGNGNGQGNGNGEGNGNGNMGTPCPPMPCLCEEIIECLKMYNPQAMPISPTYPGMNMSYSNMTVTYNYNFGSVANFHGNQSSVNGTTGASFQAQFIEVLTQAVQDAKVGADVH